MTQSESHRAGLGSGHVAACPECREYFAAVARLEHALRDQAPAERRDPPAGLEARIMRGVTESVPARRMNRPALLVLAGAAAAIALTVGVLSPHRGPAPDPRSPAQDAVHPGTPSSGGMGSALAAPVTTLLDQDPLQTEVDSVYADARSAASFLAVNFLPEPSAQTNAPARRDG